jgi:hypothetical protein
MKNDIKIRVGRKTELPTQGLGRAARAGPPLRDEVVGQAVSLLMQCPWCGGMNRLDESGTYEAWSCAWCGNVFY